MFVIYIEGKGGCISLMIMEKIKTNSYAMGLC